MTSECKNSLSEEHRNGKEIKNSTKYVQESFWICSIKAISCVEGEISYEDAFIELIDDLTSVEMAIETVKKEEKFYG